MKTFHLYRGRCLYKFSRKEVNITAGGSSLLYTAGCKEDRINFVANGSVRITGTELMKNTAVKERMKFVCGFKRTVSRPERHVRGMESTV